MEIRVLEYFLAVVREQSISGAAEVLHLSQPTLSRQLKDMEDELGKQLFIRGNRKIKLTDEGNILRRRAEEIVELVKKAEYEIIKNDETISGEISIGSGETYAINTVFDVARKLKEKYPNVRYNITSGDMVDIEEELDKGLYDFCVVVDHIDTSKYNYITLPMKDVWGLLMKKDDEMAKKEFITTEDLKDLPLILSRQSLNGGALVSWLKSNRYKLNIVATYNLLYNAALMVENGIGYALSLDKIVNTTGSSELCFKPLYPKVEVEVSIIWKKNQNFTKLCEKFIEMLENVIGYAK